MTLLSREGAHALQPEGWNAYGQVTAIVTKAGKRFDGKPYLLAQYDQRNFEPSFWGSRTAVAIPMRKRGE